MPNKYALACALLTLASLCTNGTFEFNLAASGELSFGEVLAVAAGFFLLKK